MSPALSFLTLAGCDASPGFVDGPGSRARFKQPRGLAWDQSGNVYVADSGNHCIRRVSPDGDVVTVAGGPPL